MSKTEITENDVIDIDKYIEQRSKIKKEISQIKKLRRVPVGPYATFYFESYDTMIYQVQEMLYIERGGIEQMKDEIKAYNPLVPKGKELVATLMFEIDNEIKRKEFLCSIGDIELQTFIKIGEKKFMLGLNKTLIELVRMVKLHLFTSFTLILKIKKLKSL